MVLTNAERVARWRKKQREDPNKYEDYRKKERERYRRKKERGVVKMVDEMSDREKRSKRKQWRQTQQSFRNRRKKITAALNANCSPPTSPEETPEYHQQETARRQGRKKVRKDRATAYREIFKLKVALKKEERLKEKYKKRSNRLKKKLFPKSRDDDKQVEDVGKNHDIRKAIMFYDIVTKGIKERYNKTKSYRHRRYISSLICGYDLIRKYRLGKYARKVLGFSVYQIAKAKNNEVTKVHAKKTTKKSIQIKQVVVTFLEREDNSRVKAGKRSTITRGGIKKQIRLLNDDIKHLHAKYLSEVGHRKVSYSLFCLLRPYWIRPATVNDRETCLCKLHENFTFKLERSFFENMYNTKHINDIIKTVVCDDQQSNCMYRKCNACKDKKVPLRDGLDLGKQVTWKIWKNRQIEIPVKSQDGKGDKKSTNRVVKEIEQGTLENLNQEVNLEIQKVCRHVYNIGHQYRAMRNLKEKLTEEEVIIHIDFSENYMCKFESEIQSVHFGASKRQISIHTGIAYTTGKTLPFATLSDCLKHSPASIWAHLDPILLYLSQNSNPCPKVVHFVSDGPTTQYRNKYNFFLFSTRLFEKGFKRGTWNFMEAGHGKGPADGIGAVVKRTADKTVHTNRGDITNATELMNAIKETRVQTFLVTDDDVCKIEKLIPEGIPTVPQTMKIHQVIVNEKGVVKSRELSCFCKPTCICYEPIATKLATVDLSQDTQNEVSTDMVVPGNISETGDHSSHQLQCEEFTETDLISVETVDDSLVGKYCVVVYDELPYPGIITDVDADDELEVNVMCRIGPNRFFWPLVEDRLWYSKRSIITLLDDEPSKVTSRHCQIKPVIWKLIVRKLDLDDQGKKIV